MEAWLTVEYAPSPSVFPTSKSSMLSPRDLDGALELSRDCFPLRGGLEGGSSETPKSLVRYEGGREPRGVVGARLGLLVRGPEKVRIGRGRCGVGRALVDVVPLSELEVEMTEALRLKSANDGEASGDDAVTVALSIQATADSPKAR